MGSTAFILCGPLFYRLGNRVFIPKSGVQLSGGSPIMALSYNGLLCLTVYQENWFQLPVAPPLMPECWNLADIADLESAAVRRARASRVSGTKYLRVAQFA